MAINVTGNGTRGSIELNTGAVSQRQSPRTDFGTQVRNGIAAGASTVGSAVGVAAPFVPGAAVVEAAVTGGAASLRGGNGGLGGGGTVNSSGNVTVGADNIPLGSINSSTNTGTKSTGNSQQDLLNQTKDMQEMMQSFNLQYLQLQEKMQAENRSFSTVSNVMKTKHDTAKSSIGNVR